MLCTGGDSDGASASTTAAPSGSVTAGGSTGQGPSADSAEPSASVEPRLALDTEGLALVVGSGTSALDFGAPRDQVTTVLTSQIGPVATTDQPECGQGPRTALQAGDLITLFDGDTFVGWTLVGPGDPPLTTLAGIGVGSTLAEVLEVYEVSVDADTLGPEFFSRDGQFGGGLTDETPQAKVTRLNAGETCFFR